MTDILLIQPPVRDFYITAKRTIPYGLACIASSLDRQGFSVDILDGSATSRSRVIDLPPEMSCLDACYGRADVSPFGLFHHYRHFGAGFEHLGKKAKESGAFLVGVSSLFTAYADEALTTAEAVKRFHPGCIVVLGGHHPTHLPEKVLECPAVDYVLRGEGEQSMPELARALKEKSDLRNVPGIAFRGPSGRSIVNPPAAVPDLDRQPLPAFRLLNRRFYRRNGRGSGVVTASRGCPMRCSYCSMGGSSGITYRKRSVESVLAEIEELVYTFGTGFIDFEDENISLDRRWFLCLLDGINERFAAADLELRAMNGLFPPTLDDEIIRRMKEAGFTALNLSLASTCPEQLARFRRPDVRVSFENALRCARRLGMHAVGYIIVGAPHQAAFDSLADLLYLAGLPVIAGVSVYYPSPGSADFSLCSDAGLLPEKTSLLRSTVFPISHTTTREESITLLRLGRILNFIKSLPPLRQPRSLPVDPVPCSTDGMKAIERLASDARTPTARRNIGIILLAWFLHDWRVRGVTPDGEVYEHRVSEPLCRMFVQAVLRSGVVR